MTVDITQDPFEGWAQDPIPVEIIIGYAEQYFGDKPYFNQTFIHPNTKEEHTFLELLLAITSAESNHLQYVDAVGSESSYGLFQINWHAHRDVLTGENYMNDLSLNKEIKEMTEEEHKKVLEYVTQLPVQFRYAAQLFDQNKNSDYGIWQPWTSYSEHFADPNRSYLKGMKQAKQTVAGLPNYNKNEWIMNANQYVGNPQFESPLGDWNQSNVLDTGEGGMPPSGLKTSGGAVTQEEMWNSVLMWRLGPAYNPETGEIDTDHENYAEFINTYPSTEWGQIENDADAFNQFKNDWSLLSQSQGFQNPFTTFIGQPTYADSVLQAVYNRYVMSASMGGLDQYAAQSYALSYLIPAITKMKKDIASAQRERPNWGIGEVIDFVSASVSQYVSPLDDNLREWDFRMPDMDYIHGKRDRFINEDIKKTINEILFYDNPGLVDEIREGYKEYRIINPNATTSVKDFAMPYIKQTGRYKTIYSQKPAYFSEREYMSRYTSAVENILPTGSDQYGGVVTGAAALGSTQQEAQTAAMMSGAEVAQGDVFSRKVQDTTMQLSKLLGI
jgi:hypothetical protein